MSKEYGVLVGLDWADQKHDVCWLEAGCGEIQTLELEQRPELINEWISNLIATHAGERIAICLELSRGAIVHALMGYSAVDLYPVNPKTLADYRSAFYPSGAKDDPIDAGLLLDLLVKHREKLTVWRPDTEETRLLRRLCEDRRKAVDLRTRLCNSMRSRLKEYFPQALKLVGEQVYSEMSCAFLTKWPRFEKVAAARPDTVRRFYHAHYSRSEQLIEKRLKLITSSCPLTTDAAEVDAGIQWVTTLIIQIRGLNRSIREYDNRIASLFKEHPDQFIFQSLPGAGKQLAPRLIASFGTDRSRYSTATDVATYFGIAPVMERSGKSMWIHWRWHCPTFLRQSVVEFAGTSILYSQWAALYYHEQIKRGKGHHAAVRALAFKWLRIIFRCWQNRVPYDETQYMTSLLRHGSWIASQIQKTA